MNESHQKTLLFIIYIFLKGKAHTVILKQVNDQVNLDLSGYIVQTILERYF